MKFFGKLQNLENLGRSSKVKMTRRSALLFGLATFGVGCVAEKKKSPLNKNSNSQASGKFRALVKPIIARAGLLKSQLKDISLSALEEFKNQGHKLTLFPVTELSNRIVLSLKLNENFRRIDPSGNIYLEKIKILIKTSKQLGEDELSQKLEKLLNLEKYFDRNIKPDIIKKRTNTEAYLKKEERYTTEKSNLLTDIANNHGISITYLADAIPITGKFIQEGKTGQYQAFIVHSLDKEEYLGLEGLNLDGGLTSVFLNSAPAQNASKFFSSVIANEFSHTYFRRVWEKFCNLHLERIDFSKIKLFRKAGKKKTQFFKRALEPRTTGELSELFSDSWSSQINPRELSRIGINSLSMLLNSGVRSSISQSNFSPATVDHANYYCGDRNSNYRLTHVVFLQTMHECFLADSNLKGYENILSLVNAKEEAIVKILKQINETRKSKNPNDKSKIHLLDIELHEKCQLEDFYLEIINKIPERYLLEFQKALKHYEDEYTNVLRQHKNQLN